MTVVNNERDYEPLKKYEKFTFDQTKDLKQIAISEIYSLIKEADPEHTIENEPEEAEEDFQETELEQKYTPPGFTGFYEMTWNDLRRYARQLEKTYDIDPPFNLKASRSEIEARIKEILDKAIK